MPIFPRASQNIAMAAMIMWMAPEPSTNEGKACPSGATRPAGNYGSATGSKLHREAAPQASFVHISSTRGALEGLHAPNML
jgi:hypothetical protein